MSDLGNKKIMAKNIQYYMDLHGKTRTDMCNALGVKYTTFTDWVKGNAYPRIDKIELMANYFGIEKSDLVENRENKKTDTLSLKDQKDIARRLDDTLEALKNPDGLMFDGEILDEETAILIRSSLENVLTTGKVLAKKKYTPKKKQKK